MHWCFRNVALTHFKMKCFRKYVFACWMLLLEMSLKAVGSTGSPEWLKISDFIWKLRMRWAEVWWHSAADRCELTQQQACFVSLLWIKANNNRWFTADNTFRLKNPPKTFLSQLWCHFMLFMHFILSLYFQTCTVAETLSKRGVTSDISLSLTVCMCFSLFLTPHLFCVSRKSCLMSGSVLYPWDASVWSVESSSWSPHHSSPQVRPLTPPDHPHPSLLYVQTWGIIS